MPLIFVQRYSPGIAANTGLQTGATLNLPSTGFVTVRFDATTWSGAQANVAYTIFSFTTINCTQAINDAMKANASDVTALGFTTATFALVGSTITVTFT